MAVQMASVELEGPVTLTQTSTAETSGWARTVVLTAMPKVPPPPPRRAQKRSWCWKSLATTRSPCVGCKDELDGRVGDDGDSPSQ